MRKVTDRSAYSIQFYHENKFVLGLTQQFVVFNVFNTKKNVYDFAFPRQKNCNSMFWSYDKSKILFLNTIGDAFVYDVVKEKTICDGISFGKEFYKQCFASYKTGYFYLSENETIKWFDLETLTSTDTNIKQKCWSLYDECDKIFFFFIEKEAEETWDNYLSVKCFSKSLEDFEAWKLLLPKGVLKDFRAVDNGVYLFILEQDCDSGICNSIYLFDSKIQINYLFKDLDYINENDEKEGFLQKVEINYKRKRVYFLASNNLKVIDLETKTLLKTIFVFKHDCEFANDLKVISDVLVVATNYGAYQFDLDELE